MNTEQDDIKLLQDALNDGTLWQDMPPEMGRAAAVYLEAGLLTRHAFGW